MKRNLKLFLLGLFGLAYVACNSGKSFDYTKELIGDWVTTVNDPIAGGFALTLEDGGTFTLWQSIEDTNNNASTSLFVVTEGNYAIQSDTLNLSSDGKTVSMEIAEPTDYGERDSGTLTSFSINRTYFHFQEISKPSDKVNLSVNPDLAQKGVQFKFSDFTFPLDADQDLLFDSTEREIGSDPNLKDTDDDGFEDNEEVEGGRPLKDSDLDGIADVLDPAYSIRFCEEPLCTLTRGIDTDEEGNIYVIKKPESLYSLLVYSRQHVLLKEIRLGVEEAYGPLAISSGGDFFVFTSFDSTNKYFTRVTDSTGSIIKDLKTEEDEVKQIDDVDVDNNNFIYVLQNEILYIYNANYQEVRNFSVQDESDETRSRFISVDASGKIYVIQYVLESFNSKDVISVYNAKGILLESITTPITSVLAIDTDAEGNIYLLKPDEALLKLDKNGNLLGEIQDFRADDTLNPKFQNTFGMAVSNDGHIFWSDGHYLKGHL